MKTRFPHAKRVSGVKGIDNAHFAAAKKANTTFFYVVDGDAEIVDDFKFDYKPTEHEADYVHIWKAFNPALGISYGYGGVKLFSKKFFNENRKSEIDFSTTLTKDIKYMDEISCITKFNSDYIRAFRGAYREVAKLYSSLQENISDIQKQEAAFRLNCWLNPVNDCHFRQSIIDGANAGLEEAKNKTKKELQIINDHDLIKASIGRLNPELDFNTNPIPSKEHKMKAELFFTTRIASALYDKFVLDNLPVTELRDAISDGQLLSKIWLIDVLENLIKNNIIKNQTPIRIAILGGWIGTLALLIHARELPVEITSIDLDNRANKIAETLNYDCNFKAVTMDMYDIDYSNFDVIINTSSEHIPDIGKWRSQIPDGKILITQNNNYLEGDGHVSCVENSDEFRRKLKLSEVFYDGTKTFNQYSRFMLIGRT